MSKTQEGGDQGTSIVHSWSFMVIFIISYFGDLVLEIALAILLASSLEIALAILLASSLEIALAILLAS